MENRCSICGEKWGKFSVQTGKNTIRTKNGKMDGNNCAARCGKGERREKSRTAAGEIHRRRHNFAPQEKDRKCGEIRAVFHDFPKRDESLFHRFSTGVEKDVEKRVKTVGKIRTRFPDPNNRGFRQRSREWRQGRARSRKRRAIPPFLLQISEMFSYGTPYLGKIVEERNFLAGKPGRQCRWAVPTPNARRLCRELLCFKPRWHRWILPCFYHNGIDQCFVL